MGASMIGTAYTISDGLLRFPGVVESDATAAGVAFATDAVVTLTAMRLGDLDSRILRATKRSNVKNKREAAQAREELADLQRKRAQTIWCFVVAGGISILCNVYYNYATKGSLPLALLVGVVPIILVGIVCIYLRPLAIDYDDLAKAKTKEALIAVVDIAGAKVNRAIRKGQQSPDLAGNLAILSMYADDHEAFGLKRAMQHTGAVVDADKVTSDRMLTSADIEREWGRSKRTAQHHMAQMPEREELNGVMMVPESAYRARFGDPMIQLAAPRRRRKAPESAIERELGDMERDQGADPAQNGAGLAIGYVE
jgi:hypothetical protein